MKIKYLFTAAFSLFCLTMFASCSGKQEAPAPVGGNGGGQSNTEKEYDVFLLIGQSNMAGRGTMIAGDENVFSENVYLLNADGEPEPATNPLNRYSTIRKGIQHQQINPGFSFSKKVASETGRKILLVVNARGGSNINEWVPDKQTSADYYKMVNGTDTKETVSKCFYDEAVERAQQALKYGDLKAILWHQGESNSSNPDGYLDKLKTIADGLRTELRAPGVPFIAGEIAEWHQNASKFNPVIQKISETISNSDYVTTKDCTWLKDASDPHFSRDGQILLGERYAEKILKMCYGK